MLWGESGDHMAFRESIGYFVIFKTRVLCGGSLALREVTGGKINDHLPFCTFQSRTQDFYLSSLPPPFWEKVGKYFFEENISFILYIYIHEYIYLILQIHMETNIIYIHIYITKN